MGPTTVFTRHSGPCYPGPDLVYLGSAIDAMGSENFFLGEERTAPTGPEAGILLLAVFGVL